MNRLRLLPFLLVPSVVLGLAACSGSGSGDASTSPSASATTAACPSSGSSSKAIKVTGDFGGTTAPTVTFKKGLSSSTVQSTETVKGSGKGLADGDFVKVSYSVYQGSTAQKLGSVGFDSGNPQVLSVGGTGFGNALGCAKVGSRLAIIGPSKSLGFQTTGQIVVVADIIETVATHSTGTPQKQDPSLPTVKDKASGEPQITIGSAAAPTKTTTEVLKQGDGDTIAKGDSALVQYTGVVFSTGKVFDSSWSKGQPTTFTVADGQLIAGFVTGLVGQKVGSQVLIVIPAADGYGANPPEGSNIPKNADLVFVVDILAKG
ncbi:FKBP-type peptidyl-prolyl cis-trans isomerase [Curtobacterium sp. RRHDQ10]|uniref:FKBP-type peptidyl-prolyl cis-trans isomerase n=1 Tax=Curtobacterium phyllosphaerae TaxID=3413379 RepID=UPI003BEF78D8